MKNQKTDNKVEEALTRAKDRVIEHADDIKQKVQDQKDEIVAKAAKVKKDLA
jgi:hypothetical protein